MNKITNFFNSRSEHSNKGWIFALILLIGFITYLCIWNDWYITRHSPIHIGKEFIKYWTPFLTLCAFLLTLYKQLQIEDRMAVKKKTTKDLNDKICLGLVDDLYLILKVPTDNGRHEAIKCLCARINNSICICEQYCNNSDKEKEYKDWKKKLDRHFTQLNAVIKSGNKVKFNEEKFVNDINKLKTFFTLTNLEIQ